jgi:hypothetical protein
MYVCMYRYSYMCADSALPTPQHASIGLSMCPHAAIYVSSHYYYCYICVLRLLLVQRTTCASTRIHSSLYVPSYCYICVLTLLLIQRTTCASTRSQWSQHTSAYARHTPAYVSSDYYLYSARPAHQHASNGPSQWWGALATCLYYRIRQHTSAYVSIRQHTSAYVSIVVGCFGHLPVVPHTSAYVSIRQHTPGIRQHTSA